MAVAALAAASPQGVPARAARVHQMNAAPLARSLRLLEADVQRGLASNSWEGVAHKRAPPMYSPTIDEIGVVFSKALLQLCACSRQVDRGACFGSSAPITETPLAWARIRGCVHPIWMLAEMRSSITQAADAVRMSTVGNCSAGAGGFLARFCAVRRRSALLVVLGAALRLPVVGAHGVVLVRCAEMGGAAW